MKTKQIITAMLLSGSFLFSNMKAQGLYMGLDLGYGFPAAKGMTYDSKSTSTGSTTSTEYTSKGFGLGKGINAGLFVGYMFNKNVGAQLGISYLIGDKTTITDENTGINFSSKNENIYKGSMLRLTPALRLTVGENKLKPYMKIGLIVGVGSKVTEESTSSRINTGSSSSTNRQIVEYKGGISLGFHGGVGVAYALSDKLDLFGEIAGNYQSWAPKKSEITTSTNNGIDQLSGMKTINRETEYLKSYTETNSPDVNSPRQSSKFSFPFSSVGIQIGLILTMGAGE